MTRRWLQLGVLLLGSVVSCLLAHETRAASAPVGALENQTDLLEKLQGLVAQLHAQRQDYYQQKAQKEAKLQQARENARLLEAQVSELRRQEADLDVEIGKYRAELETMTVEAMQRAHVRGVIADKISTFSVQQKEEIEKGIPYRQTERIARLRAGSADANEAASRSTAEQFGHLWSYAREELQLAGSSETYSERATIEGDLTPYARYFRVGQWMLGYITEDGRRTALWLPEFAGGAWEPVLAADQMTHVHNTVEILDRHQAPDIVLLPIVTGPWFIDRMAP